jgi:hypothetical protein
MCDDEREKQRKLAARHEAGHAVAALHCECPLDYTSINGGGGTTRHRVQYPEDAIVVYSGPLAEVDREQFRAGNEIAVPIVGTDFEALQYLRAQFGDLNRYHLLAMRLLGTPSVQQQIERVALALLARQRLSADEVRESAEFPDPIRAHLRDRL